MVVVALVVAVLLAGLTGWLFLRGPAAEWWLSGRLLAEGHLLEVARQLDAVKRAACRLPLSSPAAFAPIPQDPRLLATSAGLLVFYTISRDGSSSSHQLSLSVVGGYTPHRAGETLLFFLTRLLGVAYDRLELTVSASTVHHAQFVLNEKEQAELLRRPIKPPQRDRLVELRREWALLHRAVHWQQILQPPPERPGWRSSRRG